jgi:hypothetical protein
MAEAFIIETATLTAGIIIAAQDRGFRFYASHPAMASLEGQTFQSVRAAQRAAEKLAAGRKHSAL